VIDVQTILACIFAKLVYLMELNQVD